MVQLDNGEIYSLKEQHLLMLYEEILPLQELYFLLEVISPLYGLLL